MKTKEEKTAGQKMREFFWEKKKKAKASKELVDALCKKDKTKDRNQEKAVRPFTPEAET